MRVLYAIARVGASALAAFLLFLCQVGAWAAGAVDVCSSGRPGLLAGATILDRGLDEPFEPGQPVDPFSYFDLRSDTPGWMAGFDCRRTLGYLAAHHLQAFFEPPLIEQVRPAAAAERHDDPVFAPWQARCPGLAFNAWDDPLSSPRRFGTRGFRLFEVDLDGDPSTPADILFYSEREMPAAAQGFFDTAAAFVLVDVEACVVHRLVRILADREARLCTDQRAGVMLVEGVPFIWTLVENGYRPGYFDLALTAPYRRGDGWDTAPICNGTFPPQ